MLLAFLLFVGTLALLIVAARWFTRSAERIGLSFGMSPFAVGVVIVAIGTSLPELISGVLAARAGQPGILLGNVLGSSISNLFLVLAAVTIAAGRFIHLGDKYLAIDLHFLLGSALLLTFSLFDDRLTAFEAVLGLLAFCVYNFYLFQEGETDKTLILNTKTNKRYLAGLLPALPWADIAIVVGAAFGIFVGANYTLQALTEISTGLGISPVTLLSIGTTLPELVVSVTAARAGKADIAVGNILGSCIFNALVVPAAGVLASGGALPMDPSLRAAPLPFFLLGVTLFYLLTQDKRISRYEALLLLVFYALFIGTVVGL